MLETAIVGGGVCGVALARSLRRQGREVAIFEARPRLGGRVLTETCAGSGLRVDLGPSWFWPETQPRITHLVAELGLSSFAQHDQGVVRYLREADKKPEQVDGQTVHNGARRLEGGMASLIDTLGKDIPQESVHLGHVLLRLQDRGDHVSVVFATAAGEVEVQAQHVALAVPPRLLEENVRFEPDLDAPMHGALSEAGTWMAAQAKVAIGYDRPYWREDGQSGNAFASHEQAVIGEIFDACDGASTKAALGGFLALSPELRQAFSVGLPILMTSQMTQLFGPALDEGEQHYQDWATEPYTCSTLDRTTPLAEHTGIANPLLRRALWGGKLFLGGSETAAYGAGYLEGALEAAQRLEVALERARTSQPDAPAKPAVSITEASLARFGEWVSAQGDAAFDGYYHRLHQGLATQQRDQLTQRAILGSLEHIYGEALGVLKDLEFDMRGVAVERGRSALTPEVQKPFRDFMQTLMDDVVAFNRTSCALSNFPDEHHLSKEYVQTILRDIAAAWQEFSLSANALLLEKAAKAKNREHQPNPASGPSA
jgi:monoamine oxidase